MVRVIFVFLLSHLAHAEQPVPAGCPSGDKIVSQQDASAFIQLERGHVVKSRSEMRQQTPPVLMQTAAHISQTASQTASQKTESSEQFPDFSGWADKAADAAKAAGDRIHDAEERTKEAVENMEEHAGDITDSIHDLEAQASDVMDSLGNVSETVDGVADQLGVDEYVDKMRSVVDHFSDQARSRVVAAQANLEAQLGEANSTFALGAVKVIVETGKAAEKMAEQFIGQLQAARDQVAEKLAAVETADEADKAALAAQLEPVVGFLGELLSGTTQLMGTSVEALRGSQASTLDAVKDAPATVFDLARQSLNDADVAIGMASAFAESLKASVQQVADLSTQLLTASDDSAAALQQEIIHAARRMSTLLTGDFVAEERARQLEAAKSAAFAHDTAPLLAGLLLIALSA